MKCIMFHHAQLCVIQIQFKLIKKTPSNSINNNACTLSSPKKVSKNSQLNNCKYKRQQKAEYRKQY